MGLRVSVGRGVNLPTIDAKYPNPPAIWCQLTDEALCHSETSVKRPTVP
jgi:hypothetical protein